MKLTTLICCAFLIAFGFFAAVYALSGFDLLLFLCAGNSAVYRSLLSLAGIRKQREALRLTFLQGEAFYERYGGEMDGERRAVAAAFAAMGREGWFARRRDMLRYGFTKSGLFRNIGLFFLI